MKQKQLILFVGLIFTLHQSFSAEPVLISSIPGTANNLKVIDNIGYYAVNNGLLIMDEGYPDSPLMLSFLELPDACRYIDIQNNFAYLTAGSHGLFIIDISNPQNPIVEGNYRFDNITNAYSLVVIGSYAYVAYGMAGVRVVDVSNPSDPIEVGHYLPPDPDIFSQIIFTGSHLVSNIGNKLHFFNISNPVVPELSATKTVYGSISDMAVLSNKLLTLTNLSDGSNFFYGLISYDISNIYSIPQISQYNTGAYAYKLRMDANHAYIGNGTLGVTVLQIDALGQITLTGSLDGFSAPVRLALVQDGVARITGEKIGIHYMNVPMPAVFEPLTSFPLLFDCRDVVVSGNHAYIADGRNGIAVIDISNPYHPAILGHAPNTGNGLAITLNGNHAYIADGQTGVGEYNISNPDQPVQSGSVQTANWAQDIVIRNSIGYVAVDVSGIQLLNLAIPGLPSIAGPAYNLSGTSYGITLSGDYAITASGGAGIHIVDVSKPSSLSLTGTYNTPGSAYDVCVVGNLAYVADAQGGLIVVDIQNPASPFGVGQSTLPTDARRVHVFDNKAYVADWNSGIMVFDISDATNISLLAEANVSGTAHNLHVDAYHVMVAAGSGGFKIYQHQWVGINEKAKAAHQNIEAMPNPSNGNFHLLIAAEKQQMASLSVTNLLGQEVCPPLTIMINEGKTRINSTNLLCMPGKGTYLIKVSGESINLATKVVIN
jgi:hypothetical protein